MFGLSQNNINTNAYFSRIYLIDLCTPTIENLTKTDIQQFLNRRYLVNVFGHARPLVVEALLLNDGR